MKFLPALTLMLLPFAAANGVAASSTKPIKLAKTDDAFFVQNITPVDDNNRLCIAGAFFDPDETKTYGILQLVDTQQGKILWQKKVPAPEGYDVNTFSDCKALGSNLFVVSNVNTSNSPQDNHQIVYIDKFSQAGTLIASKKMETIAAHDNYAFGFTPKTDTLQVFGNFIDQDSDNHYYSMFVQNLDTNLKFDKPILYKTGSYIHDTAFKATADAIYIGGFFRPHKFSDQNSEQEYANSKIHIGGVYNWSAHPQHSDLTNINTAIGADGTIYSVGFKDKTTYVAAVDGSGKLVMDKSFTDSWCRTNSSTVIANTIYAVREECSSSNKKLALVSIDGKSGQERRINNITGAPQFIQANQVLLNVAYKDAAGNLMLSTLPADSGQ